MKINKIIVFKNKTVLLPVLIILAVIILACVYIAEPKIKGFVDTSINKVKTYFESNSIIIWTVDLDDETLSFVQDVKEQFLKKHPEINLVISSSESIANSANLIIINSDSASMLIKNKLISKIVPDSIKPDLYEHNSILAVTTNSDIYGTPFICETSLVLYYNKDYVKQSPKTTNELSAICSKIMNSEKKPESCFEAAEDFDTDLPQGYSTQKCGSACAQEKFITSKTAMAFLGPELVKKVSKDFTAKLGYSILPINSKTGVYLAPKIFCDSIYTVKISNQKTQNNVKTFMEYLNSLAVHKNIINKLEKISPLKAAYVTEEMLNVPFVSIKYRQFQVGKVISK